VSRPDQTSRLIAVKLLEMQKGLRSKNAIYVTPEFSNKVFAASILIHELSHYCGGKQGSSNSIEHRASPLPPTLGRRLEDGSTNYADMTADLAYRNAISYQLYCDPNGLGKPPQ